jgi:hypothetical protein
MMNLDPRARKILESFAASYPLSAHYRGGRKLKLCGLERIFPGMYDSVDIKEDVLSAVDELVGLGVVSVKWKRHRQGDEVEALYLEDPERLFGLLRIPSPEAVKDSMLSVLDSQASGDEELSRLFEGIRAKLEAGHPFPCADSGELSDILSVIRIDRVAASGSTIRSLSVRMFNDSKRLEKILPLADKIGESLLGEKPSEWLGLKRSYPEVGLSLCGSLVFKDGHTISLRGEPIILPYETVQSVARVEPEVSSVLSVENKESFYVTAENNRARTLSPRFGCVLYCGGHINPAVRDLIAVIAKARGRFSHFGDMDPDGLLIFQEVDAACGGGLEPFLMDAETHRRYLSFGYPLRMGSWPV